MRNKYYEVRRYYKETVFDSNLRLVYRWFYIEKHCFSNKVNALKYFTACNNLDRHKAVLRLKERRVKRGKRKLHL